MFEYPSAPASTTVPHDSVAVRFDRYRWSNVDTSKRASGILQHFGGARWICYDSHSRYALVPPSTVRFAPVIYEASGPATNATSAATSSTCP